MGQNAHRTQYRASAQSALERVRQAAKGDRRQRLTALMHHVYAPEMLEFCYYSVKRGAAAGIDGETWQHYGESLAENLQDLSDRLKRGAYRAKPVKRVQIPKPDGRLRPIGLPALENKIVQRAVAEVLNAVYEQEFLGFSYGFRPGRNPHRALDALHVAIRVKKVSWVLDADIREFFDTLRHEWLVKFIEHRIGDRRIIRLIQKWLKEVCRMWMKVLRRRSRKHNLKWERMKRLIAKWLPPARVCHPYPEVRFGVIT